MPSSKNIIDVIQQLRMKNIRAKNIYVYKINVLAVLHKNNINYFCTNI